MTAYRVEFLFEIGSSSAPLHVARDTLGKSYTLSHEGLPIQVMVPQRGNDFLFWRPFVPGGYSALMDFGHEDEVFVHVILVSVTLDADVPAATPLEGEALGRAVEVIDKAQDVAARFVTAFVAWVRATTRMTDLPLSNEVPPLAGPVRAFDVSTGLLLQAGPSIRSVLEGRDPANKYHLAATDMDQIIERIQHGDEAPAAETLLADAEHYARHGIRDLRRAVLMAAIACEVKVKEILRNRAAEAQRSLLDFALDNPHEVTVTAAGGLFDKLMLATLGRSLPRDDNKLFKDIERLYTVRNDIAHRGIMPDEADVDRVVRAARRCFAWLDSLPQPQSLEGSAD